MKKDVIKIIISAILFFFALIVKFSNEWINNAIFIVAYIIVGAEIIIKAIKHIEKGKIFDEHFLMSVATIGAFAIGEFPEAVAVMLFYQVGELFQDYAVDKSRNGKVEKVNPKEVKIHETIVVKPGEKIPLDGKVVEGKSSIDTKALTGETLPQEVEIGSKVLSRLYQFKWCDKSRSYKRIWAINS